MVKVCPPTSNVKTTGNAGGLTGRVSRLGSATTFDPSDPRSTSQKGWVTGVSGGSVVLALLLDTLKGVRSRPTSTVSPVKGYVTDVHRTGWRERTMVVCWRAISSPGTASGDGTVDSTYNPREAVMIRSRI